MAAAQLFAERGLDGATMSEIAGVTGIPRATLYYYFDGKESVFACMCALALDRFEEVLSAALSGTGTAAERLGRLVQAHLDFCAAHPAAFLAMHLDSGRAARRAEMSERILRSYLRPVVRLLGEGVTDGTIRPVANTRTTAAALLGATTAAAENALLSTDKQAVAELYEPIMSLVFHGLDARAVEQARLPGGPAAVYHDRLPGNVPPRVADEPQDRSREVVHAPGIRQRRVPPQPRQRPLARSRRSAAGRAGRTRSPGRRSRRPARRGGRAAGPPRRPGPPPRRARGRAPRRGPTTRP